MGHAEGANDMSAVYREKVADANIEKVATHVRQWLFSKTVKNYLD